MHLTSESEGSRKLSKPGGIKRAGAVRPRSFPLSSPYSSTALLGFTLLGSSIVGALAQEVITAATFSVLR
jgi:hypothetical protein